MGRAPSARQPRRPRADNLLGRGVPAGPRPVGRMNANLGPVSLFVPRSSTPVDDGPNALAPVPALQGPPVGAIPPSSTPDASFGAGRSGAAFGGLDLQRA